MTPEPLFCDCCTRTLTSGKGEFYMIRIEAVADPTLSVAYYLAGYAVECAFKACIAKKWIKLHW
jgi:hypothetical protein